MTDPRSLAEEYSKKIAAFDDGSFAWALKDAYLAGFKAALASEEVKGLVEALQIIEHHDKARIQDALQAFRKLEDKE